MSDEELVTIDCTLKMSTPKAFLLESSETGVEAWVPRSATEYYEEDKQATLPRWMAEEKGLV